MVLNHCRTGMYIQVMIKRARLRHHMLCYKRRLETLTLTLTGYDPVIFMHGIWLMVIHSILEIQTSLVYQCILKMEQWPAQTFHPVGLALAFGTCAGQPDPTDRDESDEIPVFA